MITALATVFAAPGPVTGYAAIAVAVLMLALWLVSIRAARRVDRGPGVGAGVRARRGRWLRWRAAAAWGGAGCCSG